MNEENNSKTSQNLCIDDVLKKETVKIKRIHRRNSSLSIEISNKKQWLVGCFLRFKNFINDLSKNTPYKEKFTLWLGKIDSLNMMYISILATSEFFPVLEAIKNDQKKDIIQKVSYAINKICLHFDIDLDYINESDYDKLCRYMCLFCQSCIEDN